MFSLLYSYKTKCVPRIRLCFLSLVASVVLNIFWSKMATYLLPVDIGHSGHDTNLGDSEFFEDFYLVPRTNELHKCYLHPIG